ncbi:hypothetical protein DM860_007577 [Cuscuta australis]|uniref:Uncharacterized protein n=1 Tax=Cuscuta australis TaxID=267555 RepID=A0A328E881_9ASTE|nr:hypothetical protein DM860_007577 [Cuscuta australis]
MVTFSLEGKKKEVTQSENDETFPLFSRPNPMQTQRSFVPPPQVRHSTVIAFPGDMGAAAAVTFNRRRHWLFLPDLLALHQKKLQFPSPRAADFVLVRKG